MIGREELSWKERVSYGSGDFALNLYWQGVGFFLFFFYTDVLGLPNEVAGLIFMIGGIWDAVSDPIMGYIAERSKNKNGLYRPYIIFGSIPLAISGALIFVLPPLENETMTAVMTLSLLLIFRTCYTIVSIPYSALGARLTRNSRERTRLSGTRMYLGFLGGLTISALAVGLRHFMPDQQAFAFLGAITGIIAVVTLYVCYKNTHEMNLEGPGSQPASSITEVVRSLASNRPFLILLVAVIFVTVTNTVLYKTLLYYFQYFIGSETHGNTAFFVMTSTPLVSIPFWSAVALRIGKKRSWSLGGVIAIAGFIVMYFDNSGSGIAALMEISLITWGMTAYAVLLWSMLPDTIDYGEYHSSVRNESIAIGLLSSAQKATIAGSAMAIGLALNMIGYEAGVEQATSTLDGLKALITLVPIGALAASIITIHFYPLSADILSKLRSERHISK